MATRIQGLLMLMAACILQPEAGAKTAVVQAKLVESASPLRIVEFTLPGGASEVLYAKLRGYADKFGFAIRIAPTTPDSQRVLIEMWREEIRLLGLNAERPSSYTIAFYKNIGIGQVPDKFLDQLVSELTESLEEIKGLTFTTR
ncbi:hypothetical protein [Taklimakanibacter lacteus]|uniref:hypothetical protein n=1 Tax=Taklimakanibacter lacteus TaxID=2268456 RepID=UPI000E672350